MPSGENSVSVAGKSHKGIIKMRNFVPKMLRSMADIYEERNKAYGDNYILFGSIMQMLFPRGVKLESVEEHNRFGIFVQIVAKVTRYANNFERGGHKDSLQDLSVYSAMLLELDTMAKEAKK